MTIIILPSTVNVNNNIECLFQKNTNDRIQTYLRSVLQWLHKTNFKIILVENSGYNFDELNNEKELYKDRFEVITFKQNELESAQYLKNNISKGASEIYAINYGYYYSKMIKSDEFIIKVTARFFINELEEYLNQFDLNNYDCLTQQDRDRCELLGCHPKNFEYIFDVNIPERHIENVWKNRTSRYNNILICKTFIIEETQRGGMNEKYNNI